MRPPMPVPDPVAAREDRAVVVAVVLIVLLIVAVVS